MSIRVVRETHEAPEPLARRIADAGGRNRYGEPNYRLVWGWSRLSWMGGKWADTDANGNLIRERIELREEPKYFPFDRWHIERWMPPESYGSPERWYALTIQREDGIAVPELGPYPRRGEYEHVFTLEGPAGEFIPLTFAACEAIVLAVQWSRNQPSSENRAALARREERSERDWESNADALLDDAVPAFHGQPFVSVTA